MIKEISDSNGMGEQVKRQQLYSESVYRPVKLLCNYYLLMLTDRNPKKNKTTQLHPLVLCSKARDICQDKR